MNDNITEALSRILANESLSKHFAEINELDDLYKFCLSVKGGYTQEEFYNFMFELIDIFDDSSDTQPLDESEVDLVAGGTGNMKKFLASGLAAMTFLSSNSSSFAAETASSAGAQTSVSENSTGTSVKSTKSLDTRIKEKLKKIWKDHKGKILLGTGLLTVSAIAAGFIGWNAPDWIKNYKERQNQKKNLYSHHEGNITQLKAARENAREDHNAWLEADKAVREAERAFEAAKKEHKTGLSGAIQTLSTVVAGTGLIGAAGTGIKSLWDLAAEGLGKLSDTSKKISNITGLASSIGKLAYSVQGNYEIAKSQLSKSDFNVEEKKAKFEEDISKIKGQEQAKEKIRTFYYGILKQREIAKFRGKGTSSSVIVLNGTAGIGKTMFANALGEGLCAGEVYSMNGPNELDGTKDIKHDLLGDGKGYGLWDLENPRRGVAEYLQRNPEGVVIINEYDKIKKKKPTDTHPLDELLRGILDEGTVVSGGQVIDCSKVTFILTTNETDASLDGRVKAEGGRLVDPDIKDDKTGSRTIVLHDKSFLTRIKRVSFQELSEDAYCEIAKQEFAPLVEFMRSDIGEGVNLDISDETYRKIAKYTASRLEGARPIKDLNTSLCAKMGDLAVSLKIKDPNIKLNGKTFKVSFDFDGSNENFDIQLVS